MSADSRVRRIIMPGGDRTDPQEVGSGWPAKDRVEKARVDYECLDWFLCLKKCPQG